MNAPHDPRLSIPALAGAVGQGLPHESAALHVSGRAAYTDDLPELAGTLHAALGLSPVAHGWLRAIDALKSFDIIYVITQGGPGTASETINIFLYLQAFAFYNVGFASAVVVVFFLLILAMSVGLLLVRRRTSWQ